MYRLSWLAFVAAAALLSVSCADLAEDPSSQIQTHGFPIINGDPPNAPMHDAVVALHQRYSFGVDQYPFCSGTLIAPDVVISAGHCVDVGRRNRPRAMDPSDLAIYVGDNPTTGNPTFRTVSEVWLHPDYDGRNLFNDISLIRLVGPVSSSLAAPVPPLPPSLALTNGDIGTTLNFAGFGDDEFGNYGVKLQADGELGGLGCTVAGCYGADDPVTQFSYTQYEAGPCFGDSGGPAFVQRGGTWYVAGLTSWGDSYCTQFGVSTTVSAYSADISGFIGVEVCGNGVCGGDEDCTSCESDCGACPFCGDGTCDGSEDCGSCESDCGACPFCGDGTCDGSEDCSSCESDCGACPFCGDGSCDSGEDCGSCESDCGVCSFCGDGVCDSGESCGSCESDCGACPTCGGNKDSCSVDADCCSFNCRGGRCRGN